MSPPTPAQRATVEKMIYWGESEGSGEFNTAELDALVALLAATEPPWQDIATAPKDWAHVLVADEAGNVCEAYHNDAVNEWVYANQASDDEGAIVDTPTHWKALPAPPEKGK